MSDDSDLPESSDAVDEEDSWSESTERLDFDKNLPTAHKYLGKLDTVSGYTLFDDGEIIQNMVGVHTNTLVFPGFTLPLVLQDFEGPEIGRYVRQGRSFALICSEEGKKKVFEYGVVMEVVESSVMPGAVNLKAKARQRCQIVRQESGRSMERMQKVTVRILAEPLIRSPIGNTQLLTLKSRRSSDSRDYKTMMKNYKYRRYHLSQYPCAPWVYDHNELSFYVNFIKKGLLNYYPEDSLPQDPYCLSFWFVQNHQLTYNERLAVLKCNSVIERLRLEIGYLEKERILSCGRCGVSIALQTDVFAMSKDGVQSNYCNPGGNVYETVTVSKARNFELVGMASKQFSWFPGYAWTIMECALCSNHLGWQFTAKRRNPSKFYGLGNSCLEIRNFEDALSERQAINRIRYSLPLS